MAISRELRAPRAAFTLLEVMAVVMILGFVFLVMGNVYRRTVGPTATSPSQTEVTRRGLLLIERIARDFEATTLIKKPDDLDPLAHPWLFYAESRRSFDGADRIKFDARSARVAVDHATDLAVVAYWSEPGDGEDLRLVRWSAPSLPESLDRAFPSSRDEGSRILASGLSRFFVRFVDSSGNWVTTWDSTTAERSSELPTAVEITLALRDSSAPEGERRFTKLVTLPLRPVDLAKALAAKDSSDSDDEDEDDGCVTVQECVSRYSAAYDAFLATQPDPDSIRAQVASAADQCWELVQPSLGIDLGECE